MRSIDEVEKSLHRKRLWRIMIPFMLIPYIFTFLDRVNIGYAILQMSKDLNFTAEMFGLGAGIFFIGYFILEIPITVSVEQGFRNEHENMSLPWNIRLRGLIKKIIIGKNPRELIARIMIGWGIVTVLTSFVHVDTQFYALRLALGFGEAGFFPAMIVYISHWFRENERARAHSILLTGIPISQIIGAPISTHILTVNWLNIAGWKWLFILEGLPAAICGIIIYFYLTDKPRDAKWLDEDEKKLLDESKKVASGISITESMKKSFIRRDIQLLAATYFFLLIGFYGLGFFLPTIVSGLTKLSVTIVGYLIAIPYGAAFVVMWAIAKRSDKKKERWNHIAIPLIIGSLGLGLSMMTYPNLFLSLGMFSIATVGIYSALAPFWTIPSKVLTGTSLAFAIAFINSMGNLGGFVGPYIIGYLKTQTGSFVEGEFFMVVSLLIAVVLIYTTKKITTSTTINKEIH